MSFLQGQGDALMIGKLIPMATLSVYNIGRLFGTVPAVIISSLAFSVVFPVYSRARNQGRPLGDVIPGVRLPLLLATGVLTSGLVASSHALVDLFYDERAADARWIVQWLAAGSFFAGAEVSYSAALLALGQARWLAFGHAAKLAGMVVGIPGGFALFGLPGAVAGLALAELLRYAVTLFGATRYDLAALRHDGLAFAATTFTATVGLLVHEAADTAELPGLLHLTAVGLTVALTWGFLLLLWHRRLRRDDPVREVSLP
jgi:O-antigen/teichoic acid export membrane protein